MKKTEIKKARRAVKMIALQEKMSQDDVRSEMKAAISEAMQNPDPEVRAIWKNIPCKGETPEPEELIAWLAGQVTEKVKI